MSKNLDMLNEILVEMGVPHESPSDKTEPTRRVMVAEINARLSPGAEERYKQLVDQYGVYNVWDSDAVGEVFVIEGFMAPFCYGRKRDTGEEGTLTFCHSPRFYFNWRPSG